VQGVALTAACSDQPLQLSTNWGTFVGIWRGEATVAVGDEVHVELDVERDYNFLEFEQISAESDRFEVLSADATTIIGRLEEIDSHGVLTLHVGGTFVRFDLDGQLSVAMTGIALRVVVDDLQLYPTNI
jgi:hypothetical protein